jgi:hypothetical protein
MGRPDAFGPFPELNLQSSALFLRGHAKIAERNNARALQVYPSDRILRNKTIDPALTSAKFATVQQYPAHAIGCSGLA